MTITKRKPQAAINKAIELEKRGYIVAMSAKGDKLILTYMRKAA